VMIALYARVSTDGQETGLASQLAALRRFVKQKYSGKTVMEFVDDGYSGTTLDRPQMDALRTQLREGRVSIVLAVDPDRLSREPADTLLLMKEVEAAGATFDFVIGGFEQSDNGRMLLHMRIVFAEYERRQIRTRTQRGRLETARRGKVPGGPLTYGLDRQGGVCVINPAQAGVVRRIFSMLLEGKSVREIIATLNRLGIEPQRGLLWRSSTVHRILRNKTYAGITNYNRRKPSASGKAIFRPEAEWISIEVPAIIDLATFERAQEQLKRNAEVLSGRNDKRFYVLRGLLRCGLCGCRISGCASHGRAHYRCGGRDRLRGLAVRCRAPWIPGERIEVAVINAVKAMLKAGVLEAKIKTHAPKVQPVNYAAEIAKAHREIESSCRAEERAGRFLVAPEHADRQHIFEKELDRATKHKAVAEQRKMDLEHAQAAAAAQTARADDVRETCRKIQRKLSRLSREQWRAMLQLLLDEITVTGRKVELRGILPTGAAAAIPSTTSIRCGFRPPPLQVRASQSTGRGRP
jgi:site-specific DNA recombinase